MTSMTIACITMAVAEVVAGIWLVVKGLQDDKREAQFENGWKSAVAKALARLEVRVTDLEIQDHKKNGGQATNKKNKKFNKFNKKGAK